MPNLWDVGKGRELEAYRTETRTLSCPESESVLGSISAEISPASTVSKSTSASSGSTLLTSISLVLTLSSESSPPFLLGVVGVLGLFPSDFFAGEPGTIVKPAICFARGLDSVDMAALYRFVVEDSKLDVGVSEIMDVGLLGVYGILDAMALGFDDGVAGIGGMAEGRGVVTGRRWGRFDETARLTLRGGDAKSLACGCCNVELREVEPTLPFARAGARDASRAVKFNSKFCLSFFSPVTLKLDRYVVRTRLDPI